MVDYEKVVILFEKCKQLYPNIPDHCLWALACDYYINGEKNNEKNEESKKRGEIKKMIYKTFYMLKMNLKQ